MYVDMQDPKIIITPAADVPAPSGVRPSTDTRMTKNYFFVKFSSDLIDFENIFSKQSLFLKALRHFEYLRI